MTVIGSGPMTFDGFGFGFSLTVSVSGPLALTPGVSRRSIFFATGMAAWLARDGYWLPNAC